MRKRLVGLMVLCVAAAALSGCSTRRDDADGDEALLPVEDSDGGGGSLGQYQQGKTPPSGKGGPLGDIQFGYDASDLNEQAMATLRSNADYLQDHSGVRVEIEGHCDERGTIEYNLALGAKRARSARDYLVALGVSADRLTTISYGEELPLCNDHSEGCWQENRRVHFVVRDR